MFRAKRTVVVKPTEVIVRPQPLPRTTPAKGTTVRSGPVNAPLRVRRSVKIRRSWPIRAYVGPNGHGKSLAAVLDLMPSLDRGRPVLSTVPLLDWRARADEDPDYVLDPDLQLYLHRESGARWERPLHPHYVRLTEWSQIVDFEFGDILLDDVAGVASSRQSSGMPAAIEKLLQKLRHADITLAWTAPAWARADLVIRETTQAVTTAVGHRPEKNEDDTRMWRRNRLFEWTTYDSKDYTDWSEGKKEKAKRLCFQRYNGPGSDAFNAYDSLGGVDTITSVTDAGRCVACGGTRRAPACSCPEYVHRVAEGSGGRERAERSGARTTADGSAPRARHRSSASSGRSVAR